jgi:hypothetical protein
MSTYQLAIRSIFDGVSFSGFRASFWKWWIGLYADAPRKLPPML